jgi:protein-S-isoprenylcysteine O-methyltransferase Ste14
MSTPSMKEMLRVDRATASNSRTAKKPFYVPLPLKIKPQRLQSYNGIVTYLDCLAVCWAVFIVFWGVSATHIKKDVRRPVSLWISVAWRAALALAVISVVRVPSLRASLWHVDSFGSPIPALGILGVVLCAGGVATAVWARKTLGENWSSRPSVKAGHELVTSGPYQYVRHPIYFGMLVGVLGTAMVIGLPGVMIFLVVCVVFATRVRVEEKLMMQQFPDQYTEYRSRTKAIIPYVL